MRRHNLRHEDVFLARRIDEIGDELWPESTEKERV